MVAYGMGFLKEGGTWVKDIQQDKAFQRRGLVLPWHVSGDYR